ncbi:MAG TPA: YggT family protein [Legionella sp.]|nr:YggT family protein [Legionella sp.]
MSGFASVGYFLFTLLFSLLTFLLWARLALRFFRVSALHPMSQTISAFTSPIVTPIARALFKSNQSRKSRYDWACFSVLVMVELVKFTAIAWLFFGGLPSALLLVSCTVADLVIQPCNLLFYAILIRVIMSWINPRWNTPFSDLLYCVTEPLLRTARHYIPAFSGFDLSPFLVIILLKAITLFISASLPPLFI